MKTCQILAALICLLCLLAATLAAEAKTVEEGLDSRYNIIIDDQADLLTPSLEAALVADMLPLTRYGCVAFYTTDTGWGSAEYKANEFLDTNFTTNRRGLSCTVFMIDMQKREIWIQSRGGMNSFRTRITASECYTVTDSTAVYATRRDYYGCASRTFRLMLDVIQGHTVPSPMRWICSAMLAAFIALIIDWRIVQKESVQERPEKQSDFYSARYTTATLEIVSEKLVKSKKTARSSDSGSSCGGGGCGGGGCGGGGGGCGSGGGSSF